MRRLVIATNNEGKLREFERLLDGCGFELVTPRQLGVAFDPEEKGSSYEENATIKALEAARLTGLPALADDSGLEIDELGGRPGIFSARYAGGDRTDPGLSEMERCRIVLTELVGVPEERRGARFRCVVVLATPRGDLHSADGQWEGRIAHEPRGEHGFGYDPIFIVADSGLTSAELTRSQKDMISHRGQALTKMREVLRKMADADPSG